jgi:starch phosphorylase
MEIGIEDGMPTYSGGLGVLAGDTIRAAADLKVPMVGMTLLHRRGYFINASIPVGGRSRSLVDWVVQDFLVECQSELQST